MIDDINTILKNKLSDKVFEDNSFDFDPLLEGYNTKKEWFECAYKLLVDEVDKRK